MKKPTLISVLAVAVATASLLSLPASASASSFKDDGAKSLRGGENVHPVHYSERYNQRSGKYRGHSNILWAPPRYRHDRGHHYGEYRQHGRRDDYRPVERYHHRNNDDLRLRIFYELHL